MVRRSVADDSYGRGPFTRSIELDEVETLPRSELDLCVAYREGHSRPHARGDVDGLLAHRCRHGDLLVVHGHACASAASRCATILAMSAGVAFPPLITRTVRSPRGSTLPARTAASGAAPDGS